MVTDGLLPGNEQYYYDQTIKINKFNVDYKI